MVSCYLFNIFCMENIAFIFQPILNTKNSKTDENYVSKHRHPSRATDFVVCDKRDLLVTCVTPDRPRRIITAGQRLTYKFLPSLSSDVFNMADEACNLSKDN